MHSYIYNNDYHIFIAFHLFFIGNVGIRVTKLSVEIKSLYLVGKQHNVL